MTEVDEHHAGPVLVLRDAVDLTGVADLGREIATAAADGRRRLVIELGDVMSIDNESLVQLCAMLRDAADRGITLTVSGAQARIGSVLLMCGIPIAEPVGDPELAGDQALTEAGSGTRWPALIRLLSPHGDKRSQDADRRIAD